MRYINNNKKIESLKNIKDFAVITDFDWTLTTSSSQTSMGIVPDFIGGELLKKRKELFENYRPIEIDYTIPKDKKLELMREWAQKSFGLLAHYVTKGSVIDATKNAKTQLRSGVKELFERFNKYNIPVVVMSAGFGNVVRLFLENEGVLYDNVTIVGNFFEFNNNIATIDLENIIFTSNKSYVNIPEELRNIIEKKDKILLFGDIIEDIKMIDKKQLDKTITFGFLDKNIDSNLQKYNEKFDVVLADNDDFNAINDIIV